MLFPVRRWTSKYSVSLYTPITAVLSISFPVQKNISGEENRAKPGVDTSRRATKGRGLGRRKTDRAIRQFVYIQPFCRGPLVEGCLFASEMLYVLSDFAASGVSVLPLVLRPGRVTLTAAPLWVAGCCLVAATCPVQFSSDLGFWLARTRGAFDMFLLEGSKPAS